MPELTQGRLKELLDYDSDTGVFRWKKTRGKRWGGKVAGYTNPSGYITIRVDMTLYYAHRLAWLFVHGYFPEHEIDHMDGVRGDNSVKNLRHVAPACNAQNQKVYANNKSGFPGVFWDENNRKWVSYISINKGFIVIGRYQDVLEAALARHNLEAVHPGWHCNHRSELAKAIKEAWPEFRGYV